MNKKKENKGVFGGKGNVENEKCEKEKMKKGGKVKRQEKVS